MSLDKTKIILGIDEVGRGPWAGPLVVGAVILGTDFYNLKTTAEGSNRHSSKQLSTSDEKLTLYQNLADSKQLSAKKRALLAPLIQKHAAASATGWVSAQEIDQYGLSASLKLATRRAVKQILATKIEFSEIIIDGIINFLDDIPLASHVTTVKKADSLIKEVSAASIIAKVARDAYMTDLATKYPDYGFESHVGYGTAKHKSALLTHGICPEHRQSFRPIQEIVMATAASTSNLAQEQKRCKKHNNPLPESPTNPTIKGRTAENHVAKYLQTLGHTIIAHNFKTKTYEIDLISTKYHKIYFTEVKYRKNSDHGSSLAQITPTKQRQMRYAAKKFLSAHSEYSSHQPLLAVAAVSGTEYGIEDWFTLQ